MKNVVLATFLFGLIISTNYSFSQQANEDSGITKPRADNQEMVEIGDGTGSFNISGSTGNPDITVHYYKPAQLKP